MPESIDEPARTWPTGAPEMTDNAAEPSEHSEERPQARRRARKRPPGGMSPRDLRYLNKLPKAKGIRIRSRRDGFGAQYMAQMSALAWAIQNNRYFYFEPFSHLDHGEDATTMSQFTGLRPWGEPVKYKRIAHVRFVPEVLSSPNPSTYFTPETLAVIRDMYHSSPKPASCPHDIAIHIRRGDINQEMRSRWLSMGTYKRLIKTLQGFFPDHSIGIYSQGDPADFQQLRALGARLELNQDLRRTFHELATSPLLIPAPSCLSYAAALLSERQILHLSNPQNRPLDHWIQTRALGMKARPLLKMLVAR